VTKNAATLDGIRAVVTGGSRGLGRAVARALAQAGASVIVTGRDRSALDETVNQIAADGGHAHAELLDIRDEDRIRAAAASFEATHGPIDVVFANAGISLVKPAVETTAAEFRDILDVNVLGTFAVVQAFGRQMLERGRGKLITVSSDIGIRGSAGWIAYGASKAAVISMTKTLAWEWAPSVTVNCIAPGAFATDINSHLLAVPEIMDGLKQATPLARVGQPDELGPLAVFMAGPGSDFMTGQVVSIDGGIQRS
jgi:NAD(P)-dependent dehydrogenase (short-subunit alcohol dehydrogenase family)